MVADLLGSECQPPTNLGNSHQPVGELPPIDAKPQLDDATSSREVEPPALGSLPLEPQIVFVLDIHVLLWVVWKFGRVNFRVANFLLLHRQYRTSGRDILAEFHVVPLSIASGCLHILLIIVTIHSLGLPI